MLVFYAKLEKDTTKSTPPRSNHVKPSALPRREDEALEANQQKKVDSASTIESANKTESHSTHAESNQQRTVDPVVTADLIEAELSDSGKSDCGKHADSIKLTNASFIEMQHGKRRE